MSWALLLVGALVAPCGPPMTGGPEKAFVPSAVWQGRDSALMAAARRAAEQWLRHDFTGLVGTGEAVMVHLPGAEPSAPLRPAQAATLLRDYASGTREVDVTILVARQVEPDRAYVEAQRVFQGEDTDVRHSETLYFGFRLIRGQFHLVEVRALP